MQNQGETDWLPISDLMSGLMMIFMLIVILLSYEKAKQKENYAEQCDKIYNALYDAFEQYIDEGNVDVLRDLTIRFNTNKNRLGIPIVLFNKAESNLTPDFKKMLLQFYPIYIQVLRQNEKDIQSLRIEGHTSSVWGEGYTKQQAYFKNMKLSQDRAREILKFVLTDTSINKDDRAWATQLTTANGLSSNKLMYTDDGTEDADRSRRVEFKAIATSCQRAGVNDDA